MKKFNEMTPAERLADLRDRVIKFNTMQLPGQPFGMHMGTCYLVSDLLHELERVSALHDHYKSSYIQLKDGR